MEIAIGNSLKSGDNLLVVSHGFSATDLVNSVKACINDLLQSEWKDSSREKIEERLKEKVISYNRDPYSSSTGGCPIERMKGC